MILKSKIKEILFQHPNYEKTDFTNDIALMKLERPIEFTDSISPICLPNGRRLQLGNRLLVTGWVSALIKKKRRF